ncbi:hypothetical protein HYR69_00605 [Candidatus Sumerlaeota bacterium]|nr:hypothetical protein [Candidatus Sumerlaeota bacterium]
MNPTFFQQIESNLAQERLDAYRKDGATPAITLARYLWNMALCEALYSPLQIAEIALRNALHGCLTNRCGRDDWFNDAAFLALLPSWQQQQLGDARQKLVADGKAVTPGQIVAELHFGFWTGFFNKAHAASGLGFALAHRVFRYAPRSEQDLKKMGARWRRIRELRNRVFHHERIIHWRDLYAQHAAILQTIAWISPELHEMADALDRFTSIQRGGLDPWIVKIRHHWSDSLTTPVSVSSQLIVAVVPNVFDATNGAETPFGHRWGGDVFHLSAEHLAALQGGQILALDVQNEYIAFLKCAEAAKPEQATQTNPRRLGHGG